MSVDSAYAGYEAWKDWSKPFTFDDEHAEYFVGELAGVRIAGADVLEIGFGSGNFLAWARENGAKIAGTEINSSMLAAARQFGVELLKSDFETVASDHAGRFDTIVAFDVFEHFTFDEIDRRIKACEQMLKPGGHLILRFPNGQSPFGLICQNGDRTHRTALSRLIVEQFLYGTSLSATRYAPSFRPRGKTMKKRLGRAARYLARDVIATTLNLVYGQDIPWDPVVVIVLRKASA